MPIYEYEPEGRECLMCEGRIQVLQSVDEEPLSFCPQCGLGVKRVISQATLRMARPSGADRAGQKGFTTFRRVEEGKWERVGGEGPDLIAGSSDDVEAVRQEKAGPRRVVDLDSGK